MMGSRPEGLNESGAWLARSGGRLRKARELEYATFLDADRRSAYAMRECFVLATIPRRYRGR